MRHSHSAGGLTDRPLLVAAAAAIINAFIMHPRRYIPRVQTAAV